MKAVLTYHSIDDSGSPISVSPATFRSQLEWLSSSRVPVVSLEELACSLDADGDAIAITFDDAFESSRAPITELLARHMPVTVFVVSGHAGRTNSWGGQPQRGIPELGLLDWNALGTLVDQGVSIGAHSRFHPRLTGLPDQALDEELGGCLEDLERNLGVRPRDFAYPYGDVDARVERATAKYFARAYSTDFGPTTSESNALLVPRLDVYYFRRQGQLDTWGTPAFTRRIAWCRFRRSVRAALP